MHTTLIDCATLRGALGHPDWIVVDCRFDLADTGAGRRAYLEAHIPGARYADLDADLSGPKAAGGGRHPLPAAEQMRAVFGRLGIDRAAQVVAYDAAGGMLAAARFWWLLRYMGHAAVAVLDGGWPAWLAGGHPTEAGDRSAKAVVFAGEPHTDRVVPVDAVPQVDTLIDSRDPARYRGEIEPIDPVPGHIPGAANYFCKNNLDPSGHFRPREELKAALGPLLGHAPGTATFYCGSGVTACQNILAAVHAGFAEPRLYPGSWSEWCADPARPVARG
jgi:thiosulfate/3-mercaptopyruvate sulfurtransferase